MLVNILGELLIELIYFSLRVKTKFIYNRDILYLIRSLGILGTVSILFKVKVIKVLYLIFSYNIEVILTIYLLERIKISKYIII